MPDPLLDYQSPPPPPSRKSRVARWLTLIAWTIWTTSLIGAVVFNTLPHHHRHGALGNQIAVITAVTNIAGFAIGLAGGILGKMASFIAAIMNLATLFLCLP